MKEGVMFKNPETQNKKQTENPTFDALSVHWHIFKFSNSL